METEYLKPKQITILGSTGSIGTQTLDIIEEYPERFKAVVLTARRNWQLLAAQARKFMPKKVVITEEEAYLNLKEALNDLPIEVQAGADAVAEAAAMPEADIVVTAMVGYSGLIPTVAAIRAGKIIALANKETLVVAGEIITKIDFRVRIVNSACRQRTFRHIPMSCRGTKRQRPEHIADCKWRSFQNMAGRKAS